MKWLLALGGVGVAASMALTPMMMTSTMGMATSGGEGYTCSTPATTDAPATPATSTDISATVAGRMVTLDPEQTANAKTIIETGRTYKVPERGWIVAIATALQESTLKNLSWGDRDSVGLFQQRRLGWGTFKQRTTPATSARMFYEGGFGGAPGLMDIGGWQLMPVSVAAQRVQVSAFPGAYAKWEGLARAAVGVLSGGVQPAPEPTCEPIAEPTPDVEAPGDCKATPGTWPNGRIPTANLCVIPFDKRHRLQGSAVAELIPLDAAYKERFGRHICITDSYRTYDQQVSLYATKPGLAAKPGTSNHGWGLALDLCGGVQNFGTPEHVWLASHGPAYGWRNPSWAVRGGSRPEPWHFSWRTDN